MEYSSSSFDKSGANLKGSQLPRMCGYTVVICVHAAADNMIETHKHTGDFKEW